MVENTAVTRRMVYLVLKFEMPRLKSFDLRLTGISERNHRGEIQRVLHSA
jgi:hypothetical protein